MRNLNRSLLVLGLAVALVGWAAPGTASADRTTQQIEKKTEKAMGEYDMMEFEAAKSLLMEAIALGEKNDSEGPELAQAYLSLGIVQFSGMGDEERALEAFRSAVALDPGVEISVAYRTPELSELLEEARRSASGGGSGGGCDVEGVAHELVDEAATGSEPEIRARLGKSKAKTVKLFYRPEGQLEFSQVAMEKRGECEYVARIPKDAVQGEFVHYYIAAVNARGKELDHNGSSGSPNIIEVSASGGAGVGDNDDPLAGDVKGSVLTESKPSRIFLSVAVGSGGGFVTGPTEKADSPVRCCLAPAPLHLMPEIGYYLSEQMSLSAAFRMGFPIGANVDGHATFAPAGLLRVRYALGASGQGLQVSGALGGGVIRNTVEIENAAEDMNTDTTVMGPVLIGAGVGYSKSLGGPLRFIAEINALGAVTAGITEIGCSEGGDGCVRPKNGAQFDANLAMLFAF